MPSYFEQFMRIVFKEVGAGNISVNNVGMYLFEYIDDKFKENKYGYGKTAVENFSNLLKLCTMLNDFDFVNEIWLTMKDSEKTIMVENTCKNT